MNEYLTGPVGKLRRVLHRRRHTQGSMPVMTNADLNSKQGNINAQWWPFRAEDHDGLDW